MSTFEMIQIIELNLEMNLDQHNAVKPKQLQVCQELPIQNLKWAMLLKLRVLYADIMSIVQNAVKNETLFCRKDSRQEVADYDKHASGFY